MFLIKIEFVNNITESGSGFSFKRQTLLKL